MSGATSRLSLTRAAMMSALDTSMTNRNSPLATCFIASVISFSWSSSPKRRRRMKAILVDVEDLPVSKLRCRADAGLTMACGASGCSAEVVNANERPPKRRFVMGDATAVVTPDRWARLRRQPTRSSKRALALTGGLVHRKRHRRRRGSKGPPPCRRRERSGRTVSVTCFSVVSDGEWR